MARHLSQTFGPARWVLAALCLLACATVLAQAPLPEIPDVWSDSMREAMGREAPELPDAAVSIGDGEFEFRIPGRKINESGSDELVASMQLDFGAQSPAECSISGEELGLATLAWKIRAAQFRAFRAGVGNGEGDIERVWHYYFTAYLRDDVVILGTDWLANVVAGDKKVLELFKLRSAHVNGTTVVCSHGGFGYLQSFNALFERMVQTLTSRAASAQPYFVSLVEISAGGKTAGYSRQTMTLDEDGETLVQEHDVLIVRTEQAGWVFNVQILEEWSAPNGDLINAFAVGDFNGERTLDLELFQTDDGWATTGWVFSKVPIKKSGRVLLVQKNADVAEAHPKGALRSGLGYELDFRTLLANPDGRSMIDWRWSPYESAGKVAERLVEVVERDGERVVLTNNGTGWTSKSV